ncbi:MAG: TAT-variant-translocated molybdopterin oxidoreductase [Acidobacteriaceae bacterium]
MSTAADGKLAMMQGAAGSEPMTMADKEKQNDLAQAAVVEKIPEATGKLTLAAVREKLNGKTGKRFWRSMDELADTPEFHEMLEREFPRQSAGELVDAVSRRGFMKLMGASLALAGLSGCTKQPDEEIFPYIRQPEDLILGRPMYFATAYPFSTGAVPLLVKSDAFRPIKVEGNPDHPLTHGGSDVFSQGSLLALYDPDRAQHVTYRGENHEWAQFQAVFRAALAEKKASGGQGVYILSETITSPTLAAQWKQVQAAYPNIKLAQYDPVNRDSARAASKTAFGDYFDAQYQLAAADVILSLDADFLSGLAHPGFVKLAGDYARRRKLADGTEMNRLYVVESAPTTTGFKAEHRLALKASEVEGFAAALVAAVAGGTAPAGYNWSAGDQQFLAALVADLKTHAGKCVVIPGEQQTAAVHMAAIALNQALGNVGKTVVYTETVNPLPTEQFAELKSLVGDLNAGKVDWLVLLNVNPIYTASADLGFADAFAKAKTVATLSAYKDETALISHWHIHSAHYLESWSDARAYDGTVSIIQPMISPLYGGKSAHDILQTMLENPALSAYEAVRSTWKPVLSAKGDFELAWRKALHAGWIEETAFSPKTVNPRIGSLPIASSTGEGLEVIFRPDPSLYDGRFANVGWLQELPKPITNLSWDNAALMSMDTMARLGVEETDIVVLNLNGRSVKAPVLMVPGHPNDAITVYLGFGRESAGRAGSAVGFNAYTLRTSAAPLFASGATIKKTGDYYAICVTKSHYEDHRGAFAARDGSGDKAANTSGAHSLEGNEAELRGVIRYATLEEFKKNPGFAHDPESWDDPAKDESLFPAWNYKTNPNGTAKYAWGMAIDMNSCVGCNACIVSCYAENNIPVVGREQVKIGRNMQWIRIDTYFEGDLHAPKAHFQPLNCQHCENAGCEQVCPVGATVHTPEGLNVMVYNRCVGTRYCSNNCPYKVRRFNFLLYSDYETESLKLMRNPDVTVRSRGVMEKCSYCIQRIQEKKIDADKNNTTIRDGDIVTACQQACPTSAITFGDLNDKQSRVAKLKAQERNYGLLTDLNTRPRTTYIAGVSNPNPELEEA